MQGHSPANPPLLQDVFKCARLSLSVNLGDFLTAYMSKADFKLGEKKSHLIERNRNTFVSNNG